MFECDFILPPDIKKFELDNKDGSYQVRGIGKTMDLEEYSDIVQNFSKEGDDKMELLLDENYFEPFFFLVNKHSDHKECSIHVLDLMICLSDSMAHILKSVDESDFVSIQDN